MKTVENRLGIDYCSMQGTSAVTGPLRLEGFRFNPQGQARTGRRKPTRIVILVSGGQRAIRFAV